jgi:hypothetical protein
MERRKNILPSEKSLADKILFDSLYQLQIPVTIRVGLNGKESNVRIIAYYISNRKIILSNLKEIDFSNINQIEITGKHSIDFFRKVIPKLPPDEELQQFRNRKIVIYPFGERRYIKARLMKVHPYFFILGLGKFVNRVRDYHKIIIKYKLFTSAYTFFNPYPQNFMREDTLYDTVKAGRWREEFKEIRQYLKELLGTEKTKVLTFALKDGKEITGIFEKRRSSNTPFCYRLFNPDNPKEGITIFKHAIDDLWEN